LRPARPPQRPHRRPGPGVRRRGPAGHAGRHPAARGLRRRGRAHPPPGRPRVRGVAGPVRGLSRAMAGQRSRIRRRREQLETMLAGGQARLDRARSRSMVVDTMVGVVRRERPVAIGILAASLAFRLFALMIPLTYVVVAGLRFAADSAARGRPPPSRAPPPPPPPGPPTCATWWCRGWPPPATARSGPAGWP